MLSWFNVIEEYQKDGIEFIQQYIVGKIGLNILNYNLDVHNTTNYDL